MLHAWRPLNQVGMESDPDGLRFMLATIIASLMSQGAIHGPRSTEDVRAGPTRAQAQVVANWQARRHVSPDAKTFKRMREKLDIFDRTLRWFDDEIEGAGFCELGGTTGDIG